MKPEEAVFFEQIPVSRETAEKLRLYAGLLSHWQKRINLVSPATLPLLWTRHFLDSAQLMRWLPSGPLLDLGSGAGFPGLVLAILRNGGDPVHLIESDQRKAAFLREVARETGTPISLHVARIETVKPFPVAVVTARALASLSLLLSWAVPFLSPTSQCLFLKGARVDEELTEAAKDWKMTTERIPSLSDPSGHILRVKEVYRG